MDPFLLVSPCTQAIQNTTICRGYSVTALSQLLLFGPKLVSNSMPMRDVAVRATGGGSVSSGEGKGHDNQLLDWERRGAAVGGLSESNADGVSSSV